tara:strand:+ start:362 stop:592 length:231 start_codon:yes stop_codon:yes gene_type:complete
MCVAEALMIDKIGGQFGLDPFGTRARAEETEAAKRDAQWAREDQVRNETFKHEQKLASMTPSRRGSNRASLGAGRR